MPETIMRADQDIIEEFSKMILSSHPDSCIVLHCFDASIDWKRRQVVRSDKRSIVGCWSTSPMDISTQVCVVRDVCVYMTVNPVDPESREPRLKDRFGYVKKGQGVKDSDITHIEWLIIDIDPAHSGPVKSRRDINSTDDELARCVEVARKIADQNEEIKKSSYVGISGNGAFVMSRVSMPNDEASSAAIRAFIHHLSREYSTDKVVVDTQSGSPSKMLGVPGSVKCKGPISLSDRPWRYVQILE